jgi:hypothetical protein
VKEISNVDGWLSAKYTKLLALLLLAGLQGKHSPTIFRPSVAPLM